MGNIKSSLKHGTASKILHLMLENQGKLLSGESLSRQLGVSRTSIWKAVNQLEQLGYPVEKEKRGYRLSPQREYLLDIENIPFSGEIFHLNQSDSTMEESRRQKKWGNHLVIADEQTQGMGKGQAGWESPKGGLFITLHKEWQAPLAISARIASDFLLHLAAYFQEIHDLPVLYKWPHELYLADKKLAGSLVELEAMSYRVKRFSLGLGVHLNNPCQGEYISLKDYSGKSWDRNVMLEGITQTLTKTLQNLEESPQKPMGSTYLMKGKGSLLDYRGKLHPVDIHGLDALGNILSYQGKKTRTYTPVECQRLILDKT